MREIDGLVSFGVMFTVSTSIFDQMDEITFTEQRIPYMKYER